MAAVLDWLRESRAGGRRTDPRLSPLKLHAIDVACERFGVRTLADLGGGWGVEGGYAFHAADRWDLDRTVVVDEDLEAYPAMRDRAARDASVELIEGNFGTTEQAERVGSVDAVLLFDVLLHQVSPASWSEVLSAYTPRTRVVVLAGPWWRGPETVRLPDFGEREYLEAVPDIAIHRELFARIDEINPQRGLKWRDCHDVWQWGIADRDLRDTMADLGLALAHFENHGAWPYRDEAGRERSLPRFFSGLYVFARREILGGRKLD